MHCVRFIQVLGHTTAPSKADAMPGYEVQGSCNVVRSLASRQQPAKRRTGLRNYSTIQTLPWQMACAVAARAQDLARVVVAATAARIIFAHASAAMMRGGSLQLTTGLAPGRGQFAGGWIKLQQPTTDCFALWLFNHTSPMPAVRYCSTLCIQIDTIHRGGMRPTVFGRGSCQLG